MQSRKVILYPTLTTHPIEVTLFRMDDSVDWEDRAYEHIEHLLWSKQIDDIRLDVLSLKWLTDAETT